MAHANIDVAARPPDIVVQTRWDEKELVKQVPGARWDPEAKVWRVRLAWASAVILRGVFGDSLILGQELIGWAWSARRTRVDPALALRQATSVNGDASNLDSRLYDFQKAGVQWLRVAGDALLGDDMGCGKSPQAAALAESLGADALPALIICPNSVKRHWGRHVKEWTTATAYVLDGGAVARRKLLDTARKDPRAVVIINLESVRLFSRLAPYGSVRLKRCRECDKNHGEENLTSSRCEVHPKPLNGFGFKTVVLDEAHRIKDPKSKQTRACWAVMHDPSVKRRLALTGTPIANHPGDLWSIMHAIAKEDYPTRSAFVDRFCMMAWNAFGGLDIVGVRPETREEFFRVLDPRFRRMTKELVLPQLPPKVRSVRYVDMTTQQAKMYKELGEALVTRTEDGALLIAPSQLAAVTRLSQLALASVNVERPDPDDVSSWQVTLREPSPKLDELELVIEELGNRRFVVAAEYKQIIDLAAQRLQKLGVRHALITGDVSNFDRERALDALGTGHVQCVLFTLKAGGVGLDMSAADTLINLQRSWSMVDNVQAENRVHRIGSERHESVHIVDIITRGTIEEDQVERLYLKLERLEQITRDREALRAAGVDIIQLDQEEAVLMQTFLGSTS